MDTISLSDGYLCCHGIVPPRIVDTRKTGGDIVFSFDTMPGQTYITEFKNVLSTNAPWTPLQTNAGDGTTKSVTNSTDAATTSRFFPGADSVTPHLAILQAARPAEPATAYGCAAWFN